MPVIDVVNFVCALVIVDIHYFVANVFNSSFYIFDYGFAYIAQNLYALIGISACQRRNLLVGFFSFV